MRENGVCSTSQQEAEWQTTAAFVAGSYRPFGNRSKHRFTPRQCCAPAREATTSSRDLIPHANLDLMYQRTYL